MKGNIAAIVCVTLALVLALSPGCSSSKTSASADASQDLSTSFDASQDQSSIDDVDTASPTADADQIAPSGDAEDGLGTDADQLGNEDLVAGDLNVEDTATDVEPTDAGNGDTADSSTPSTTACDFHDDCPAKVRYPLSVSTVDDCYCTYCDSLDVSLNNATHDQYQSEWKSVCADWSTTTCTDTVLCAVPLDQYCLSGECRRPIPGVMACEKTEDCVGNVQYLRPVYSEDECYCPGCDNGSVNLNVAAHSQYQKMWVAQCSEWAKNNGCGPVNCLVAAPPRECRDKICLPTTVPVSPTSCETADECTVPVYSKPVTTIGDCYCPMCPVTALAINKATETLYQNQWTQICNEWAKRLPCPVASCLAPKSPLCESKSCKPAP